MRDAIAFAVDEGWAVPGWLRSLIVDAPSSVVSPITSNQSAGEQGAQEYTEYLPAPTASRVLSEQVGDRVAHELEQHEGNQRDAQHDHGGLNQPSEDKGKHKLQHQKKPGRTPVWIRLRRFT